jgi:Mn2+/Fe2+ NRAMP family transporter
MRRVFAVLFWSVISAAFIGPGTVTAAASAGAAHGLALLWALLFSTVACLVLQEASARLTVVSGRSLGQALRWRYPAGISGLLTLVLVLGAIVLGCAAYEAGNILGAVAGVSLSVPLPPKAVTVATVAAAAALLWFNSPRRVAVVLSALVAVMGGAFLWTAIGLVPDWSMLLSGALSPGLPESSALLAIALVGTTVVPYNLFLGSGLARGQSLGEIRFGLGLAIGLGGLISMGVLVVGTATTAPLEFSRLASVLEGRLGELARPLFAFGLFAAGLSSAVTAPLAAAITAQGLFAEPSSEGRGESLRWAHDSWRFRSVWIFVLLVGLLFGVSEVRPIPVILLAQALNGILLPFVALFLGVAVNDRQLMGDETNHFVSNVLMTAIAFVALLLGVTNVATAASRALGFEMPGAGVLVYITVGVMLLVATLVVHSVRRSARADE